MLERFAGREAQLFESLEAKYFTPVPPRVDSGKGGNDADAAEAASDADALLGEAMAAAGLLDAPQSLLPDAVGRGAGGGGGEEEEEGEGGGRGGPFYSPSGLPAPAGPYARVGLVSPAASAPAESPAALHPVWSERGAIAAATKDEWFGWSNSRTGSTRVKLSYCPAPDAAAAAASGGGHLRLRTPAEFGTEATRWEIPLSAIDTIAGSPRSADFDPAAALQLTIRLKPGPRAERCGGRPRAAHVGDQLSLSAPTVLVYGSFDLRRRCRFGTMPQAFRGASVFPRAPCDVLGFVTVASRGVC